MKTLSILSVILFIIGAVLFAEGGIVILPFMLITYLFANKPNVRNTLYLVLSLLLFIKAYVPYPTVKDTIMMLFLWKRNQEKFYMRKN